MSVIANDLVSGALRVITSITPGEAIDGQEADNGFTVLNWMLASWSAKNLMVPYRTTDIFTPQTYTPSYTIGPGANFDTVRPDSITYIYRRNGGVDYTIDPITKEQYNAIALKSTSGGTYQYCYDPQYPNGVLYFSPLLLPGDVLYVESFKPVNQFASLNSTMALPGEYQEAVKYLLAERLAPEYGFQITQDIASLIQQAKASIMRKNLSRKVASFDPALMSRNRPYNIYEG